MRSRSGGGTNARPVEAGLRTLGLPIHLVDEYETSRARAYSTFESIRPAGGGGWSRSGSSSPPGRWTITLPS